MDPSKLEAFETVYRSSKSFWSNYVKAYRWLNDQGYQPVSLPVKCPFALEDKSSEEIVRSRDLNQMNDDQYDGHSEKEEDNEDELPVLNVKVEKKCDNQSNWSDVDYSHQHIDDDYIRFIMETREHQRKRAEQKAELARMEEQSEIVYKDIREIDEQRLNNCSVGNYCDLKTGKQESLNHSNLYGVGCESIRGKETLLQSDFNIYCDTNKPQFWPTIPVKIQ